MHVAPARSQVVDALNSFESESTAYRHPLQGVHNLNRPHDVRQAKRVQDPPGPFIHKTHRVQSAHVQALSAPPLTSSRRFTVQESALTISAAVLTISSRDRLRARFIHAVQS